jgi:AcrR family transcriptional regulator
MRSYKGDVNMDSKYISTQETANKWGVSRRRVSLLCVQERIPGVVKISDSYLVPSDAVKPDDLRIKNNPFKPVKTLDGYHRTNEYFNAYTTLEYLKRCEGYTAAKEHGDIAAADAIVKKCVGSNILQAIKTKYPDSILLPVINRTNARPLAFCINIGLPVCLTVRCLNEQKRRNLQAIQRIIYKPVFSGEITAGRSYILVDDVITQGGTISSLMQFVSQAGGMVSAVLSLASAKGSQRIAPTKEILDKLNRHFGNELPIFFEECGLGTDVMEQLTHSEILYLLKFSSVDNIRRKWSSVQSASTAEHDSYVLKGAANGTETISTKEKIMFTAARLFSKRGYIQSSMNDIAKTMDMKPAIINKYFRSKRSILTSLYEFYIYQKMLTAPTLEKLLSLAETSDLHDILKELKYHHPPELQDKMDHILVTALYGVCLNDDSERFIKDNFLESSKSLLIHVLNRLVELGKIEPIDIEAFADLLVGFDCYAASINQSSLKLDLDHWSRSRGLIFSLLKMKQ